MPMPASREFQLDEDGRRLTLRGEQVPLRPLVFRLLSYLVRHAGRVVPKNELMEALWPDLHVTEAALQRAVSLARGALRLGGLDGAIRSVSYVSYRFALDWPTMADLTPTSVVANETLSSARRAADERRWSDANDLLLKPTSSSLDPWTWILGLLAGILCETNERDVDPCPSREGPSG